MPDNYQVIAIFVYIYISSSRMDLINHKFEQFIVCFNLVEGICHLTQLYCQLGIQALCYRALDLKSFIHRHFIATY